MSYMKQMAHPGAVITTAHAPTQNDINIAEAKRDVECFIDERAVIGKNVKVWHYARVLEGAHLQEGVSVGGGSEIGRHSIVCAGARIGANVFLPPMSFVGRGVFIGPGCIFTDDKWPKAGNEKYFQQPPGIGAGASIGAGAVILPGVVIGEGAVIGAGTIVTHNVPARHVLRGDVDNAQRAL